MPFYITKGIRPITNMYMKLLTSESFRQVLTTLASLSLPACDPDNRIVISGPVRDRQVIFVINNSLSSWLYRRVKSNNFLLI